MKTLVGIVVLLLLSACGPSAEDLIPYKVLDRKDYGTIKSMLKIEVDLVDGRLPTEKELGDISQYLVDQDVERDRTFVVFYLPDTNMDYGGFATAHHQPDMLVDISTHTLAQYPLYQKFSTKQEIENAKKLRNIEQSRSSIN